MHVSISILNLLVISAALTTSLVTLAKPVSQQPSTGFHGKRLIQLSEETPAAWMSEADILKLYRDHTHFVDITETQDLGKPQNGFSDQTDTVALPTELSQQSTVKSMLALANTDLMKSFLPKFTTFHNRYYRSENGAKSSNFLFDTVKDIVANGNPGKLNITVTQFTHSFPQSSVIARIEGLNSNDETVIVGAHQDSINGSDPMNGRSPGADDDGSGTSTTLEAFRILLASKYQPLRPVEFHWYAGEEGGLLGSAAIAQAYKKSGRKVAGMVQFDMTMFPSPTNPDIGLLTDFTSPELTNLLEKIIKEYTTTAVNRFQCGYGCSDHASWNRAGYPSSMPAESSNLRNNRNIHTTRDDMNTINYDHGLTLAKVAVGFAVEMSHQ